MAKHCALSTGKLPRGDLPRNNSVLQFMVEYKAINQTNKSCLDFIQQCQSENLKMIFFLSFPSP